MTTSDSIDVLVVGGGPVGVGTALMCARRGLTVVVLERSTEVYDLPRAIVMDDEIQRAIHLAGAGDGLAAVTSPVPGAEFIDVHGTRIIGFDIPDGVDFPAGFHPVVRYYQPELEQFLRDAARSAGVNLRLGVEVTSIGQDDSRAWAELADGTTVHGTWLIAADGAASPIRKSLGIAFEDQGFDQDWLVVDVELLDDGEHGLPRLVQQICDPQRPSTFVPGHARFRRWEFQLQPAETREQMSTHERVWELLSPWLTPEDARIVRAVVYRFHALVAATMRAGRIFLAGDSAHQMPPFLGQGLCSGLRDGANLAWKLQAVARGEAGDQLLDTYDVERRPHAAGVVAHAADTGRTIDQLAGRDSAGGDLQNAYGGHRPFPHLEAGVMAGAHPAVGRQVPNPLIGGVRLDQLAGDGFFVVVADAHTFAGTGLEQWRSAGAHVVTTDALEAWGLAGAVVVRPDRYVAAVATDAADLDALTNSLMGVIR